MKKQHIKKTIRSMFIFLLIICLLTGCKTSEKKTDRRIQRAGKNIHYSDSGSIYRNEKRTESSGSI